MLKFGDIIKLNGCFFIYLAQKNDNYTYYFAKIISDPEHINLLLQKKENYKPSPRSPAKEHTLSVLTCFVQMTTDDFGGQLAFLGKSEDSGVSSVSQIKPFHKLNDQDIQATISEILDNTMVLPPPVVRAAQEINSNE